MITLSDFSSKNLKKIQSILEIVLGYIELKGINELTRIIEIPIAWKLLAIENCNILHINN